MEYFKATERVVFPVCLMWLFFSHTTREGDVSGGRPPTCLLPLLERIAFADLVQIASRRLERNKNNQK